MIELGLIVPGMPQPLLAPEQNEGWGQIRAAFQLLYGVFFECQVAEYHFTIPN